MLVSAVSKLTKIASQLAARRKKDRSLEGVLDGVGSGASESSGLTGARRHAAALRALRAALQRQPEELQSPGGKSREGLQCGEPSAWQCFSASDSSCLAGDEKPRAELSNPCSPPVGGSRRSGLHAATQACRGTCSAGADVSSRRSVVDRPRQLVDCGRDDVGGWTSVGDFQSAHVAAGARSPVHQSGGRKMGRPLCGEVEGFRGAGREKEKAHSQEDSCPTCLGYRPKRRSQSQGKRQRQRRWWQSRVGRPSLTTMIHPADVAGCGDEEKVLASGWPAPGFDITSGTADGDFPSHLPVAAAPSLRSSSSARVLRDSVKCSWGASSRIQMGRPLKKDVKDMRPPGSNASTVRAPTLWNSLLRWMLRSRAGKLGSFLHSFLAGVGRGNKPCTLRSVWPLPVPYRFDVYAEDGDEELALQRAVNVMVLVLNWLHLGSPSRSPPNLDASATLTPPQQSVVQRLRRFCQHWIAAGPIAAADMGRTASKIEDLEEQLAFLGGLADQLKDTTGSGRSPMLVGGAALPPGDPTIAKDIEAHRLKFTGVPAFDPRPWMTAEAEVWYDRPLDCALPPEEHVEEVPHVQVKGKRKEILKLLHALDNSNRLAIFPQEDIRDGYQSGMFSLIKDLQKDRLILDSRPANTLEWPLSAFTQCMGSPVPLLDYELPSDCILLASGEDLRDFYYFYVVSNQRAARNCIKFRLSPEEASTFRCKPNVSSQCFYPALATMAMGDVNAVEFGQMSHTLLAHSIGIRMEDLLTLRGRVPRQSWMCGLVIDDLIFLEAVPRSLPKLGVTGDLAEAMLSKYDEVGLQANADKRFRGERCSKFWGIFCDGEDGLVRPQVERALPVAMLTAQIARGGVGERKLLETLAGTWTAILQMRRRAMCLLEVIFLEIQRVEC